MDENLDENVGLGTVEVTSEEPEDTLLLVISVSKVVHLGHFVAPPSLPLEIYQTKHVEEDGLLVVYANVSRVTLLRLVTTIDIKNEELASIDKAATVRY